MCPGKAHRAGNGPVPGKSGAIRLERRYAAVSLPGGRQENRDWMKYRGSAAAWCSQPNRRLRARAPSASNTRASAIRPVGFKAGTEGGGGNC